MAMAVEIAESLGAPQPWIPSKYFYDDRGSALFEEITRLPEYYQTRTEVALLEAIAEPVLAMGRPRELVELGSGAGRKIRILLDSLQSMGCLERCLLLDINESFLSQSVQRLQAAYPHTDVRGVQADFIDDLEILGLRAERLLLFFGGTLGNVAPHEVPDFFRRASRVLAPGDTFLVGIDLVKDHARLEAAYNDAAGVTARFNLNILRVLNEKLGADFDLSAFEHVAFYDETNAWIEMRVRARRPSRVHIPLAGLTLRLERGKEIRTELSCKYTRESFAERLRATGLRLERWFTDPQELFALALLRRTEKELCR
jgi:L-histidine N-alpha-methyltransferase